MGWFKIPFLGEVETMIKSQFGDLWPGSQLHMGPVILFSTEENKTSAFL